MSAGAQPAEVPIVHKRSALVSLPPTVQQPPMRARNVAFWSALVLAPAATYLALRLAKKPRSGVIAAVGVALGLGVARTQLARHFGNELAHRALPGPGLLELRDYPAHDEAVITMKTSFARALDEGFPQLHGYISGKNARRQRFRMGEPVLTTPRTDGGFDVAFVLPLGEREAPAANNAAITVRHVHGRRVAVLRFSGRFTKANVQRHADTLEALVLHAGMTMIGRPAFAAYDAPMTLPALRRNELWATVTR
ncbi:MAG: heme-binding protein [Polyangia bacterium]